MQEVTSQYQDYMRGGGGERACNLQLSMAAVVTLNTNFALLVHLLFVLF